MRRSPYAVRVPGPLTRRPMRHASRASRIASGSVPNGVCGRLTPAPVAVPARRVAARSAIAFAMDLRLRSSSPGSCATPPMPCVPAATSQTTTTSASPARHRAGDPRSRTRRWIADATSATVASGNSASMPTTTTPNVPLGDNPVTARMRISGMVKGERIQISRTSAASSTGYVPSRADTVSGEDQDLAASLGTTLTLDTRDFVLNPGKGMFSSLTAEYYLGTLGVG
ncbi:MAG: hypothetical protein EBS89_09950, partial [Proteobacteria bacterium]|nr:hypothetical protein [Pseudomonadota bacterium]